MVLNNDSGRTNILLLGSGDAGHAGENLTDTIILLSTSQTTSHNGILSIPRDVRVQIPGFGAGKINSAYSQGGLGTARQTVANITNQPVHYSIELKFQGLVSLVDAVGGLDIDVKERLTDPEYPCSDDQYKPCGLDIPVGPRHMTGEEVLAYVRCRKGTCGNDFGRAARQQEVINLLQTRFMQPSLWLNVPVVWRLSLSVAGTLTTDLSLMQMMQLAWQWQQYNKTLPASSLVLSTAPEGLLQNGGGSDLVPVGGDWEAVQMAVRGLVDR